MDLSRTEKLLSKQAMEKLEKARVAVVGVGGVGGYAAEMLVRSGIGNICIIDFDIISQSNINRQIIALSSTMGQPKTQAFAKRLLDINPNLKINAICQRVCKENLASLLNGHFDYVVDCIDKIQDKADLIEFCHANGIRIISAMGAGNRAMLPEYRVMDIFKTNNDGLAKTMRKKLKEVGIKNHNVVSSMQVQESFTNPVGSVVWHPSVCGAVLCAWVVNELIK